MTPELIRALFAPETGKAIIPLVTINPPEGPAHWLCANLEPITSRGITFQPAAFRATWPIDDGEALPTVQLKIDGVTRELVETIRSASGDIKMTVELVLSTDLDTVQQALSNLYLRECSYNATTVTARLFVDDLLNQKIPADDYGPAEWPGLF